MGTSRIGIGGAFGKGRGEFWSYEGNGYIPPALVSPIKGADEERLHGAGLRASTPIQECPYQRA